MNYRKFGNLGWDVSALGFGGMRFPQVGDKQEIDEALATAMLHHAIDGGVNYVDTAWGYHYEKSEPFVGKALKNGYREKVHLATKMPVWMVKTADDFDRLLDEQQRRLDVEKIDLYLLHALNTSRWENVRDLGVLDWAEKRKAEGRFSHLGFSFHDEYPAFHQILNDYDSWEFCQLQHNYMDTDYQQGQKGVDEAAARGMGVVVMEPIRGGSLALDPMPVPVAEAFARSKRDWKPAEWALQWVWNQSQVSLALSGMSTMAQVEQNLVAANRSGAGLLDQNDLETVAVIKQAFESLSPIPCTQCEYCLPCPSDVAIPSIFALYNTSRMFSKDKGSNWQYTSAIKEGNRANMCVECGQCEEACPQSIEIIDWLKKCDAYFA